MLWRRTWAACFHSSNPSLSFIPPWIPFHGFSNIGPILNGERNTLAPLVEHSRLERLCILFRAGPLPSYPFSCACSVSPAFLISQTLPSSRKQHAASTEDHSPSVGLWFSGYLQCGSMWKPGTPQYWWIENRHSETFEAESQRLRCMICCKYDILL